MLANEEMRLLDAFMREVPGVIETISDDPEEDPFGQRHPEAYLASAQWAFRRIRLAMLAAGKVSAERILDLPSGYGRVLRVLKAAFPEAEIPATSTNPRSTSASRSLGPCQSTGRKRSPIHRWRAPTTSSGAALC